MYILRFVLYDSLFYGESDHMGDIFATFGLLGGWVGCLQAGRVS